MFISVNYVSDVIFYFFNSNLFFFFFFCSRKGLVLKTFLFFLFFSTYSKGVLWSYDGTRSWSLIGPGSNPSPAISLFSSFGLFWVRILSNKMDLNFLHDIIRFVWRCQVKSKKKLWYFFFFFVSMQFGLNRFFYISTFKDPNVHCKSQWRLVK